jgi:allophanate hydrolase
VVPACRSIDCVSIFALTTDDAARVLVAARGYDAADAYSRQRPMSASSAAKLPASASPSDAETLFRFGVPRAGQLEFFGDGEYARLFDETVARLESLGGQRVTIDFAPFRAAAKLLYEGAFIAERYVAVGEFIERHPESVHPVTRQLITASRTLTAADAFRSQHDLMEAKRGAAEAWGDIDVLVTPTTGTIYRIADVDADPIRLNANLGFYTNFVNFLDLAAIAVPAGFRSDGLPFGVTLVGAAWSEEQLLTLASRLHRALHAPEPTSARLHASVQALQPPTAHPHAGAQAPAEAQPIAPAYASLKLAAVSSSEQHSPTRIPVAVCGAHLEGLPLNHQLTTCGATLAARTRTAPAYRFYALPGGPPFRPGLVRVATHGASIDVEVWSVPADHFGSFVAGIPAPLGIGKIELEDGTRVPGFICEPCGIEGAEDITSFGNWRDYLKSLNP